MLELAGEARGSSPEVVLPLEVPGQESEVPTKSTEFLAAKTS